LTPGGSSTVHIYTQTIHRTTQLILEERGPCPVFASYTLPFSLTTEEKARKTLSQGSRRVAVGTMKTECTEQNMHNNEIYINNKNTELTKLNKSIKRINIHKMNNTKTQ